MLKRIKNLFNFKYKQEKTLSIYDAIDNLYDTLNSETIVINVGEDLTPYICYIQEIIKLIRNEIKEECGFILSPVKIIENNWIQENEFIIFIKNKKTENGYLIPNKDGIREEFYDIFKSNIYNSLDLLFTIEITEKYIDTVQKKNNRLIWNLTNSLSIIEFRTILVDILKKGKSINNINFIFEQIGEQVLTDGKFKDILSKHNPHIIAEQISKVL